MSCFCVWDFPFSVPFCSFLLDFTFCSTESMDSLTYCVTISSKITYIPTYIHTYIHTYINTYIHTISLTLENRSLRTSFFLSRTYFSQYSTSLHLSLIYFFNWALEHALKEHKYNFKIYKPTCSRT